MTDFHAQRLKEVLRQLAAAFVSEHSNRQSLLTVTNISLSDNGGNAVIHVSVYPDTVALQAIGFLKRKRTEFREMVKERMPGLRRIPHIDFEIGSGSTIKIERSCNGRGL
jgi:ribosome-binding factor A